GAAVFSLDGAFIGLSSVRNGRVAIVPAMTLRSVAESAPAAPARRADLPLEVQPLTPELAKAAGARSGVMISHVADPKLPVLSGDVLRSIDGENVTSVGGYQALVQSRQPGAPVEIDIVRRGDERTVTLTALEADGTPPAGSASDFGAVLRAVPGAGAEVVRIE